jgi:putative (di)nucleoside polyphosphate hydrolase
VVYFKRRVYMQALEELAPSLYPEGPPAREDIQSQAVGLMHQRGR